MNLDKKLAKYARQLDNPKYYGKILKILEKADKKNYQFKIFNTWDLEKISGEIFAYYDAIPDDEADKRMIAFYNTDWFIVSDKNYILFQTPKLFIALDVYLRSYLILFYARLRQAYYQDRLITSENVNRKIYILRGAIKTSKFLGASLDDFDEYYCKGFKDNFLK